MSRKKASEHLYADFGGRLSSLLTKKKPFAAKIGVTYEAVRSWCNGTYLPNTVQLLEIAKELDISIDWLLTGKAPTGNSPHCPVDCDEKLRELCEKVKNVVKSKTPYSKALTENIHAFDTAVKDGGKLADHERRLKNLEKVTSIGRDGGTQK